MPHYFITEEKPDLSPSCSGHPLVCKSRGEQALLCLWSGMKGYKCPTSHCFQSLGSGRCRYEGAADAQWLSFWWITVFFSISETSVVSLTLNTSNDLWHVWVIKGETQRKNRPKRDTSGSQSNSVQRDELSLQWLPKQSRCKWGHSDVKGSPCRDRLILTPARLRDRHSAQDPVPAIRSLRICTTETGKQRSSGCQGWWQV